MLRGELRELMRDAVVSGKLPRLLRDALVLEARDAFLLELDEGFLGEARNARDACNDVDASRDREQGA